jgi:hypothetical protein
MTITGTANVELQQPGPNITGTADFIYTFNDGGTGPNADSFSIIIFNASDPALNHTSGVVQGSNVTIGTCS